MKHQEGGSRTLASSAYPPSTAAVRGWSKAEIRNFTQIIHLFTLHLPGVASQRPHGNISWQHLKQKQSGKKEETAHPPAPPPRKPATEASLERIRLRGSSAVSTMRADNKLVRLCTSTTRTGLHPPTLDPAPPAPPGHAPLRTYTSPFSGKAPIRVSTHTLTGIRAAHAPNVGNPGKTLDQRTKAPPSVAGPPDAPSKSTEERENRGHTQCARLEKEMHMSRILEECAEKGERHGGVIRARQEEGGWGVRNKNSRCCCEAGSTDVALGRETSTHPRQELRGRSPKPTFTRTRTVPAAAHPSRCMSRKKEKKGEGEEGEGGKRGNTTQRAAREKGVLETTRRCISKMITERSEGRKGGRAGATPSEESMTRERGRRRDPRKVEGVRVCAALHACQRKGTPGEIPTEKLRHVVRASSRVQAHSTTHRSSREEGGEPAPRREELTMACMQEVRGGSFPLPSTQPRTRGSGRKRRKERTSLHCFIPTPMTLAPGRLREQGIGICKDGRHRWVVAARENGEEKGIEDARGENAEEERGCTATVKSHQEVGGRKSRDMIWTFCVKLASYPRASNVLLATPAPSVQKAQDPRAIVPLLLSSRLRLRVSVAASSDLRQIYTSRSITRNAHRAPIYLYPGAPKHSQRLHCTSGIIGRGVRYTSSALQEPEDN
ncbi:hypothetical protein B0H13DRAFT_1928835 [Mycena leptocephala]|nr:hypothetical protein B0H13DRAFT_1928835 [Mycena leptocephala]